jgi:acetylornithine deacetylase/succinyl-diaminopimelate desuccinylase-like protein
LEDSSHRVTTALGGQDALDLLRGKPFDLVITDLQMSGVDGITLLRTAKEIRSNTKVIIMTGSVLSAAARRLISREADGFLDKPFSLAELHWAVASCLSKEVSSPNLRPFIVEHLEMLRADVCVLSDTSMRSIDEPAILHSLRGMTYIEVEVHGPREDLHSGLWGGAVHNPALALAQILARMFNADNTIAVPGFYDDVVPLTEAERAMIAKTDLSEAQYMASTGVPAVWGDAAYNIRERIAARPTLDVNGLWSGWSGPGPKTIVPAKAGCKLSCRLVGNQDPHKIYELLKNYIESLAPPTVTVEVRLITTGKPALFPFDTPAMQAAARAYVRGWGAEPLFTRGGVSIPVVADIADLMGIPVVLMGFGLDDDGLHSPNERYSLEMFQRGIETTIVYLEELARLPRNARR